MRYTVDWEPDAEQEFTAIWMNASDPNVVTGAANEIERRLAYDPSSQGEARSGRDRVLFEPPLVVYFEVDDDARKVSVHGVREM